MDYSKITVNTPEETFKAGYEFAKTLKAGDIITLDGDLGAGKTVFTKGICHYFNVTDYVVSPTYTIVNEYKGDISVYHFDIYIISYFNIVTAFHAAAARRHQAVDQLHQRGFPRSVRAEEKNALSLFY